MRNRVFPLALLIVLTACSARPQLYPNSVLQKKGEERASHDIDECIARAEEQASTGRLGNAALNAGIAGAAGAGGGAAGAWAAGPGFSIGRSAGVSAAASAAGTFLINALDNEAPPAVKNYVEICLRNKGYEVTGWN